MTLGSLVRSWAVTTPQAPALVDGDGLTMTYEQLWEAVKVCAAQLDLPHRSLVVLDGDRSVDTIVTYLALQEAGHVPLMAGGHVHDLVDAWAPGATIRIQGGHVDIQHPGEPLNFTTVPGAEQTISNWPDFKPSGEGRPRSSTVMITKDDGGIIGT